MGPDGRGVQKAKPSVWPGCSGGKDGEDLQETAGKRVGERITES